MNKTTIINFITQPFSHTMQNNLMIRVFIAAVIGAILFHGSADPAYAEKRVVFISSYHPGFPTFFQQVEGIESVFKGKDISLDIEYMDTKRFPQKEQWIIFKNALGYKLNHTDPYDAVIVADDNALIFAIDQQDKMFKGIPIVFTGVNNIARALAQNNNPQITGVVEAVSIVETIDLMLKLFPETRRIAAVVDDTPSGQGDLKRFHEVAEEFKPYEFSEISLADKTWPEFLKSIGSVGDDTTLLLLSAYKDRDSMTYLFEKSLEKIRGAARVPIFHLWYHGIGGGLLGGMVISHFEQGRAAAEIVQKILSGTPVSEIGVLNHSPNKYVFDYSELKKHGIDKGKLPESSLILNMPSSFYERHKRIIWVITATFTLLLVALFISIANILKRLKVEKKLKKNEEKYRTILESAMDGFWVTDTRGKLLEVNEAYCSMSGFSETELLNMNIFDMEVLETPELITEHMKKVVSRGSDRFESRHRRKDGTVFDVEVSVQHRANDGICICFLRDITKQKIAFKEINIANKKMKLASDSARFGIWDLDVRDNSLIWDDWMLRLYGIGRSDFKNAFEAWQECVHPDDLKQASREVEDALTGKREFDTEFRIIRPDGEIRWLKAHAAVARDDQGRPVQMTGINYDITEKKYFEEQIQRSQKMEAIGNLAGGIAHDFNNILFPVVGISELLLEDLPPGSLERENVEEIYRAGKRGSELVKQILAVSRQSGHQMAPTRIQKVLKEVLKLAKSTIPSDIEIKQDIQKDCGLIMADSTQIHQVAMNLVTNAFHAVEENGGRISVSLYEKSLQPSDFPDSNKGAGKYAILSVSDTGMGISEEIMDKIFDPYFTTKEQGKGTGLGLAVVHGIVKDHGGEIRVKAETGKGTTFNVYIPLLDKPDIFERAEGNPDNPIGTERILLVDDEEPIANLEKQMLERLGYQVTVRHSSPDALQTLKVDAESFDLVITDMTMPDMTGEKLSMEIIGLRPDLPIIICTGFSERIDRDKAESLGIKAFLMKPVKKSDLAQTVRKVLDESR